MTNHLARVALIMNDDNILHCLLSHKSIMSAEDTKIFSVLEKNNIVSSEDDIRCCLERKYLTHYVGVAENDDVGWTAKSGITLSPLGEKEMARLWSQSSLNPKVKLRKWVWRIVSAVLIALLNSILGLLLAKK